MDQIRMVRDENGDVFLSQQDLLQVMNERLERFPSQIEQLKKPKEGKITMLNGQPSVQPPDEKEVARHEGMQQMLEGVIGLIDQGNS